MDSTNEIPFASFEGRLRCAQDDIPISGSYLSVAPFLAVGYGRATICRTHRAAFQGSVGRRAFIRAYYGWFVDATPADHAEFVSQPATSDLLARPSTPAAGRVDLLTTVLHEMGHVLGFDHRDDGVTDDALPPATRRLWGEAILLLDAPWEFAGVAQE